MAIGYAVKHNRLPLKSLLFYYGDTMLSKKGFEVGEVDSSLATGGFYESKRAIRDFGWLEV